MLSNIPSRDLIMELLRRIPPESPPDIPRSPSIPSDTQAIATIAAQEAARDAGITVGTLMGPSRTARTATARQAAMAICRRKGATLQSIGELFNRDHGTVIHADKAIRAKCEIDPVFKAQFQSLYDRVSKIMESTTESMTYTNNNPPQ